MIPFIFNEVNNLLIHLIIIITFEIIFYYKFIKPTIKKNIINSIIRLNFNKSDKNNIKNFIKKYSGKDGISSYLDYVNNTELNFIELNNKNINYIAVILLIILISSLIIINLLSKYLNIKLKINKIKILCSFISLITMEMIYVFILNTKKEVNSNTFFMNLISSFINKINT